MNISHIASAALLSGLIVTQASAAVGTISTSSSTLNTEIEKVNAQNRAADFFVSSLKQLEDIGYEALKKFERGKTNVRTDVDSSHTKAQIEANAKIVKIIDDMKDYTKNHASDYAKLPNQTHPIIIGDNSEIGNIMIQITPASSDSESATIKLGKVERKNTTVTSWVTDLATTVAGIAEKEFKKTFDNLINAASAKTVITASDNSSTGLVNVANIDAGDYVGDLYMQAQANTLNNLTIDAAKVNASSYMDSIRTKIENNIKVLEAIKAYEDISSGSDTNAKQKALDNLNATLAKTGVKLNTTKDGKTASTKVTTTSAATDITEGTKDGLFAKILTLTGTVTHITLDNAKALLDELNNALTSKYNTMVGFNDSVNGVNAKVSTLGDNAITMRNDAKVAIEHHNAKAALDALQSQKAAIDAAKTALSGLSSGSPTTADKVKALKAAVDAGVKFNSKSVSGVAVTAENVGEFADGKTMNTDITTAITQALTAINTTLGTKLDDVIASLQTVLVASSGQLNNLADISSSKNAAVFKGMSDILNNKVVADMVYNVENKEQAKALATNISNQTDELAKTLKSNGALASIKFNNNQLNQTRLAKLANPYNKDLALAKAIKKLDGEKLADNGNALSSVIKGYTDRFENSNNLWADIIGSKVILKDGPNPELYGFSVGYDRAFDNFIVGGYASYAKSKANSDTMDMKANNYELGIYSRAYIDQNEIDTKLSYGFAKNKISSSVLNPVAHNFINNDAKFDSKLFNIEATYGYVIDLGDALYIKPLVGLNYENYKADGFKESGDLPKEISGFSTNTLSAKLGVELRKYLSEGHYLFITPAIKTELVKSKKDIDINFVGSNQKLLVNAENKKKTYAMLNAGAEAKLNDALSMNVNLGIKAASKEQHYNATLGLKYAF